MQAKKWIEQKDNIIVYVFDSYKNMWNLEIYTLKSIWVNERLPFLSVKNHSTKMPFKYNEKFLKILQFYVLVSYKMHSIFLLSFYTRLDIQLTYHTFFEV